MSRAPLVALAPLVLVLVACSSSGGRGAPPQSSGSSSSSTTASSTGIASSDTASGSSTSSRTAGPCKAEGRPPSAVRVSEGVGDVDGDGQADALSVYADGTDAMPGPWHVLVTLGGGGGDIGAVITDALQGDPSQRVAMLGTSPIGSGPGDAIFVAVGSGASSTIVGVFARSGCSLTRLALAPSTAPAQLPVGGTVTHLDGLRCRAARLERLSATSTDGASYSTSVQPLTVADGSLTPAGDPQLGSLLARDPALQDFATLTCPGVTPP